ncbi:MAG: hypothetical protein FWG13_00415 [Leptospirales bacterium]|nr:hypothetical protein [Leptospirales bacterium]
MLGLRKDLEVKEAIYFDESEKRQIIEDYLQSGLSKQAVWEKYGGHSRKRGRILLWLRELNISIKKFDAKHKRNKIFLTWKSF